jgi:hypothetical protein
MKRLRIAFGIVATFAAVSPYGHAAPENEGYRIQIARKSESPRKSDSRRFSMSGGATVRDVAKTFCYRIDIRRISPAAPEKVTVEALLVVEDVLGEILPAGYSRETVALPLGISVSVETDAIDLESVEWSGRFGAKGTFGNKFYGYVIRLRDADGNMLVERAQPLALREEADRLIAEWKEEKERGVNDARPVLRPGRPVGGP